MKEVTYEEWQKNPTPRMMWVWDDKIDNKKKKKVIYVKIKNSSIFSVFAVEQSDYSLVLFKHCAEIEEPRRMTNQELSWWLQDGIKEGKYREWKFKGLETCVIHNTMCYPEEDAGDLVDTDILIRENNGEWREPLVEVEE